MTTRNSTLTVYLFPSSPIFGAYRVPLFDELHSRLGNDFIVVAERQQRDPNSQIAVHAGHFPRRLLNSRRIDISRRHDDALETPFGVTLTPGLLPTLLKLNPGAVISNNFSTWTLTSLLAGYPTILFWEGTAHTERTVKPWRHRLRQWIARRTAAFVANGTLSKRYLVEQLGVDPSLVFEGGMGPELPPPSLARNTPRERRAGAPLRFLLVGRLVKLKGISTLVRAAAALHRRVGEDLPFEVHVLGEGPEHAELEHLAFELGVADCVTFLGGVLASEVWQSYAEADVFVLPTFQDNWPLVVPEAMFMAMPILLSRDSGSTPDLVKAGENGFAFNPADHEQLASLMEFYLRDPDAVRRHGLRSREIAARYTPQRIADAYLAALDCVPGVRGRQPYAMT